jgi:hypothetical protein
LAHLGTDTGVTIIIEGWRRDPLTLGATDCVKNYAPLGNVNRRVLEKVIEENLDDENVFVTNKKGVEEG